jgi:hypothetical protein
MICEVHGCPAKNPTFPTSLKEAPEGAAFTTDVGFCGCAQLASATAITRLDHDRKRKFIYLFLSKFFAVPAQLAKNLLVFLTSDNNRSPVWRRTVMAQDKLCTAASS